MSTVLRITPLGFPWQPPDPFLACMHHDDAYPPGNDAMGPRASLAGRELGMDFEGKDGWRMYHGEEVPGFPQHPHRGFETVTIVRTGLIDHSDSLGAVARFGRGDVQWLTAGKGIVHSEMFPLLEREQGNPLELFQIWLNLPKSEKLCEPHFSMLWGETLPRVRSAGAEVVVIAGVFGDARPPAPPPRSWAARPDSDVAIWTVRLEPGAHVELPAANAGSNRALYFFAGASIRVDGRAVPARSEVRVRADRPLPIVNDGADVAELLVLQGRPIGEPIAQHGPFVMTTRDEIVQAFMDYQRTGFGGWPFRRDDPVHPRERGRFAQRPGAGVEEPPARGQGT